MEKQILFDWSGVYVQDYKTLILSIPMFLTYAVILNFICMYDNSIIAGMLLLFLQLVVGMSLTRIYHQLGNKAKSKLTLLDPSKLSSKWTIIRREIHAVNIAGIFEKFLFSISHADKKSTDDVNDIAWFLVAVWAMVSTLLFLTWEASVSVCLASVGFLMAVCIIIYYEGYKGLANGYFEDDIDHLEYHILSRLESLVSLHPSTRSFVSWKVKRGKIVLNDFCVSIKIENSSNTAFRYYLGIPSEDKERIIIERGNISMETIRRELQELLSEESVWKLSQTADNSIEIMNIKDKFDLSKRGAFVRTPEEPLYLIKLVQSLIDIFQS